MIFRSGELAPLNNRLVGHGFYDLARGCPWRGRSGHGGSLLSQGMGQTGSRGCWPLSLRGPKRPKMCNSSPMGSTDSLNSHSVLQPDSSITCPRVNRKARAKDLRASFEIALYRIVACVSLGCLSIAFRSVDFVAFHGLLEVLSGELTEATTQFNLIDLHIRPRYCPSPWIRIRNPCP